MHGPRVHGSPTAPRGPASQRPGTPDLGLDDGASPPGAPHDAPSPTGGPASVPVPPAALRVRASVPERGLDVDVTFAPGEVVAILGENGAGKSTLLEVVAGLVTPGSSRDVHVTVDGGDLTHEPPRRRRTAWLSQRPLLFEHLSVAANVGFGPRAHGGTRGEAQVTALASLARVGASALADRSVRALSGGQAQRVSIARALATDPRVLLLDEPLASLDVGVAQHVRAVLHDAQRARPRTTLLVTHDLLDVLVLADRAVVLEHGKVVEDGPATEVVTRPRSRFAARLAGVNLLAGAVERVTAPVGPAGSDGPADGGAVGHEVSLTVDGTGIGVVGTTDEQVHPGTRAVAVFEPRAVGVHRATPEGSPRNAYPVVVTSIEPHGPLLRVWGRVEGAGERSPHLAADLTPRAAAELRLVPGERTWFVVKAAEVRLHAR
nr:ABC transporter ATP-binding protein [Oerskovia sp. JB1-3-2]